MHNIAAHIAVTGSKRTTAEDNATLRALAAADGYTFNWVPGAGVQLLQDGPYPCISRPVTARDEQTMRDTEADLMDEWISSFTPCESSWL